jgi:23S rRNA (cytosine1962-C5)-methyltransferase
MAHYPTVRLRAREGRRVAAGAPWAFSNEVVLDAAAKALAPGSLVCLAQADGSIIGTGYFNAHSLIAVRLLSRRGNIAIDEAFFRERIAAALALRERLYAAPYYRLIHAEGDGLPGVTVDRFGSSLSMQITTAGMEGLTPPLLTALDAVLNPGRIVLRNDTPSRALEGLGSEVKEDKGRLDGPVELEENGVRYLADLSGGQKTGWYYDQRDNRAFIASIAEGARVLDAYCYTGGFAIAAARAGASDVTGIDSSAPALDLAAKAAALNGVTCTFVKADVFDEFERLGAGGGKYGVVVCDPPPFVRARKDLEAGARAYRKLARLSAALVERKGFLLLASCSHNMPLDRFQQECAAGIARAGRSGALIRSAGAGPDHPVHPMLPETAYLKALVYALD